MKAQGSAPGEGRPVGLSLHRLNSILLCFPRDLEIVGLLSFQLILGALLGLWRPIFLSQEIGFLCPPRAATEK